MWCIPYFWEVIFEYTDDEAMMANSFLLAIQALIALPPAISCIIIAQTVDDSMPCMGPYTIDPPVFLMIAGVNQGSIALFAIIAGCYSARKGFKAASTSSPMAADFTDHTWIMHTCYCCASFLFLIWSGIGLYIW